MSEKAKSLSGTALAKYPRESYYLADKLPIWMCKKSADMEKIFPKISLKRTGAGYFDNYLLHALDGKNFEKCEEFGTYEFLQKKTGRRKSKT